MRLVSVTCWQVANHQDAIFNTTNVGVCASCLLLYDINTEQTLIESQALRLCETLATAIERDRPHVLHSYMGGDEGTTSLGTQLLIVLCPIWVGAVCALATHSGVQVLIDSRNISSALSGRQQAFEWGTYHRHRTGHVKHNGAGWGVRYRSRERGGVPQAEGQARQETKPNGYMMHVAPEQQQRS